MLHLTGLHILLTFQCTFECDHCFVWGSPSQTGTLTLEQIREILHAARDLGTVESIYFEGGEPFLFYPILVRAVEEASRLGFSVGLVSNSYWAESLDDARIWLAPFSGLIDDLSISSDLFHSSEALSQQAVFARAAAQDLGIPVGLISIARPEGNATAAGVGQLPEAESAVMYRGRAAVKLAGQVPHKPWETFTCCPHEDLRSPGRLHVDPLGNLHICQGISLGNLFTESLAHICAAYDPAAHPVCGPLLSGGPAGLARANGLSPYSGYADACHLCYEARLALRSRFPKILAPDQMYGLAPGDRLHDLALST